MNDFNAMLRKYAQLFVHVGMLRKYAQLFVHVGLNLQPGQRLVLGATGGISLEHAPLVRLIVDEAYAAGARDVHINWQDEPISRLMMERAPEEALAEYPAQIARWYEELAEGGAAFGTIGGIDPDLMRGIDARRTTAAVQARRKALEKVVAQTASMKVSWAVIAAPTSGWAAKVFPGLPPAQQVERLWQDIFSACRIDLPDPVGAWREHMAGLSARTDALNAKRYRALRFRGPGTDLTVGLPAEHEWLGVGGARNAQGVPFVPNLPSEEVFTAPLKEGVHGTVRSTMPLAYNGNLIEGIWLRLERGRIVEYGADAGFEALKGIIETDDGSHYLGEVALVPVSSPITQLGRLFYNTLFDENASSHLAIGRGYPTNIRGGAGLSPADLAAQGVNQSLMHVDFMIGSPELEIDAETATGAVEPLFRRGLWV